MRPRSVRKENDLLGEIEIPQNALFGVQTQRAVLNFPINKQRKIGSYPTVIEGLLFIKQAAALVNMESGFLDKTKAQAIIDAANLVLREKQFEQFPIHSLHGGGGTSANMNANEVLANLGEELLGGKRGDYSLIHPNDHVNLHQSTNDVYPTACHISIIRQWPALREVLNCLIVTLQEKGVEWAHQKRIARTCLQDAVATTFEDFLGGYSGFLERNLARIDNAVDALHVVNLGGSIVGRRNEVSEIYFNQVIPALREVTEDPAYQMRENLFDAAQNHDDMVCVSCELDLLARGLIKIGKDFRLLSSGPEAGLGELELPAVQPGSSIMPAKVNPVIPEFMIQSCFQVIGNHAACQATLDHGELDLNVWESTVVFNILDSMELLTTAIRVFDQKCVRGLRINAVRNTKNAKTIIPILTDLVKQHGYTHINDICKQGKGDPKLIKQLLREKSLI